MTAEVGIAFGGIRQVFTTRNCTPPAAFGQRCNWSTAHSPGWTGQWRFQPIGDGSASAPAGSSC
jgi:ribosome-associated toxin RatA of RatAB toxin-antitoxin module